MKVLSVIIVTFNAGHTIRKTIESLKIQTFQNFEIIIQDNHSNDDTIEIAKQMLKDTPIDLLIHVEEDKGIYDAMNKAILKANSKYVHFLNAGDILFDKFVYEKVFDLIDVFSMVIYGDLVINDKLVKSMNMRKINLIMDRTVNHQCIIYKKEIFEIVGNYDVEYKISADYEHLVRIYKAKCIIQKINEVLIDFDPNGISSYSRLTIMEEHEKIIKKYFGFAHLLLNKIKHFISKKIKGGNKWNQR